MRRPARVGDIWTKVHILTTLSQLHKMEASLEMGTAKHMGLPVPTASSQRPTSQEEGSISIYHQLPVAKLSSEKVWLRDEGSFSYPNPIHEFHLECDITENNGTLIVPALRPWKRSPRLRQESPRDLGLLLPHPVNIQILKWRCHSGRSVPLSTPPGPELKLRDFAEGERLGTLQRASNNPPPPLENWLYLQQNVEKFKSTGIVKISGSCDKRQLRRNW